MEFGYRAVFIAVPPTAPSVRSYVNRDTNAWKRKGLTDEKAEKGRGEFRAFETTSTTSVTLKIGKRGRREKKDDEKRERERELQRVNRQDSNEETSTHHFATLPVHAKRRLINESTRVPRPSSSLREEGRLLRHAESAYIRFACEEERACVSAIQNTFIRVCIGSYMIHARSDLGPSGSFSPVRIMRSHFILRLPPLSSAFA